MLSGAFAVQHYAVQIKYYYNSRVDLLQKHSLEFGHFPDPSKIKFVEESSFGLFASTLFFTVNFNLSVENIDNIEYFL